MDLDWLKDFLALVEHGVFSRAADARHVTQPAFSRRVRALEDWVGTPLFTRTAQGAALTSAGRAFEPFATELLAKLDQAKRAAVSAGEQASDSLSIAATHALSFSFFPGWISRQAELRLPGKLNLVSDTMQACEQAMLSGEVHFMLCHWRVGMKSDLDPQRYRSVAVGHDVMTAVSAPDGQGNPRWSVHPTAGRSSRLLGYGRESGLGRILASVSPSPAISAASEPVFTSHLAATLLAMARDGQGAAWLPLSLIEDDVRCGRLVKAGPEERDIPIEIRLIRSPDCRNRTSDEFWTRAAQ